MPDTKKRKQLKVCVACSPGGHLVQVRQLAQIYEKYDYFYFTFSGTVAESLAQHARVRTIPNVVRRNPLSWFVGAFLSAKIALAERPDVVITTGAGVVVFLCIISRLLGAKVIFIESMAKVEKPTLTARLLYPFSDLFFVQWNNLLKFFPKAKFEGRLL